MISFHRGCRDVREEYAERAKKVFLFRLRLINEPSEPSVDVKRFVSGEMSVAYVVLIAAGVARGASSRSRLYSS